MRVSLKRASTDIYLHLQITATANDKCTDRFSASSAAAAMASGLIALAVEAK